MPDTPLNPDALEAVARERYESRRSFEDLPPWDDLLERNRKAEIRALGNRVSAYLAIAQPEVTSVEALDQLPVGTVVIINGTMLQAFDKDDYGTMWSRVRDIDAYQSDALALPARVLYRPEVDE